MLCKLTIMVVGMAIEAMIVFYRVGHIGLMTGFAGDSLVLVLKREFCFGVVEISYAFYRVKRNL